MTSLTPKNLDRSTLLLWDMESQYPKGDWITVLWRSFTENDDANVISIPQLVEEKADILRSRYLAWLYELGESEIQGVRLIDHLSLRPDFSYWWMTFPTIFNYDQKTPIYSVIRILALEDLANELSPRKILLVSNNKTLAQTIRLWCKNTYRDFEWQQINKTKNQFKTKNLFSWARRIYDSLPYPLQSAIFLLRYIWQRWPLKLKKNHWGSSLNGDITFVDYLSNLAPNALSAGQFSSKYWGTLISILNHSSFKVNWIHHYIYHEAVPSTSKARDLIDNFNHNESNQHFHTSLDSVLSINLILAVLRDYIRLVWMSLKLFSVKEKFHPSHSSINLWPLLKQDWYNYMTGPNAISNCLFLNLFEQFLTQLPRQRLGIYLQENQGWEMAFIYVWRKSGHGKLIGVPHSTLRYWDLRYFFDPRSYERKIENKLPIPDRVAVNGPASMKMYREGGYPEDQIIEVEALRYLGLAIQPQKNDTDKNNKNPLKILVLGDYVSSIFTQQMQYLEIAAQKLPSDTHYMVKPHPACGIKTSNYASLKFQISSRPLEELLPLYDVVFTSNGTSAAVDAYCARVPVVSLLDGNTFNMSPLRGLENVIYVLNPTELAEALQSVRKRIYVMSQPYFCLDRNLVNWVNLLQLETYEKNRNLG